MTFERSPSGQSNQATFFDADLVCYVEGGGGRAQTSVDAMYWSAVFSTLRPDLRVKVMPKGGKPELESLARDVLGKDIKNTLVALDADYDHITSDIISDPRIIYTFGYSWENDVFFEENILDIISALARQPDLGEEVRTFILNSLVKFERDVRLASNADFLAFRAGSSLIPRDAPGRIVGIDQTTLQPACNRAEILKLLNAVNVSTKPNRQLDKMNSPLRGYRFLVGHLVAHATRIIISGCIRRFFRNANISIDHIVDVGIQTVRRHIQNAVETDRQKYYAAMLAAVPTSA